MGLHPLYGISLPEKNWVPAPRYLLRRSRILAILKTIPPGNWLEIGCGAGALVFDVARRGFRCSVLEPSADAADMIRTIRSRYPFDLNMYSDSDQIQPGCFDGIGAFEVLEHIDDDRAALQRWEKWLRTDGVLLVSVPAHMHAWSATDTWAGHFRRYEKHQLCALLENVGFEIERCESYGFPLATLLAPLRSRMHACEMASRQAAENDRETATAQSGTRRHTESRLYPLLCSLPGRLIMHLAFRAQTLFLNKDLGNGYIAVARKKPLSDPGAIIPQNTHPAHHGAYSGHDTPTEPD